MDTVNKRARVLRSVNYVQVIEAKNGLLTTPLNLPHSNTAYYRICNFVQLAQTL